MSGSAITAPGAVSGGAGGSVATRLLAAIPIAALLVAIYAGLARGLWNTWTTNDNYSHGPLVPLVSAALIWGRRARLAALPARGSRLGLIPIALACLLQVAGLRSDVFSLQGWSLPLMLGGLSLALFGIAWTRVLAFPLVFLCFMLTFPPLIVNQLSFALKEVTVHFAERVSEALGVAMLRDGMTLYLAGGELRVENPCSGLRSLLALLATGALFAALQKGSWWRRLALFLAAVPIAMFANALRITALIVVGHYVGVSEAGGAAHDASGYVLYGIALLGLLGVRRLLTPREPNAAPPVPALQAMGR
ncbi:MAG: exosortase/archaeosortase family protein [Candidatus Eisenbacteria bacterium]